jgi:hypothetical protein
VEYGGGHVTGDGPRTERRERRTHQEEVTGMLSLGWFPGDVVATAQEGEVTLSQPPAEFAVGVSGGQQC